MTEGNNAQDARPYDGQSTGPRTALWSPDRLVGTWEKSDLGEETAYDAIMRRVGDR